MKHKNIISTLIIVIAVTSSIASLMGIFSDGGNGQFEYESIRGQKILIYGKGLYQHMSADVAIQGIAQDYVTLFAGIPLLIFSLISARKNSLRGLMLLCGTTVYFFVTYLFYMTMGMYNKMFLIYSMNIGLTFFAILLLMNSFNPAEFKSNINSEKTFKYAGIFMVVNSIMVSLLWLGVVVPPLLDGSIIPPQVQHYTTLIVQGFDLGLLLPIGFVVGLLAIKKNPRGYFYTHIYVVFLSILMTALTSKIIFMANSGANVIPVVFIMPTINIISIVFSFMMFRELKTIN